jgi:acetyl esterase/lipase
MRFAAGSLVAGSRMHLFLDCPEAMKTLTKTFQIVAVVCALGMVGTQTGQCAARKVYRIMAVGDSITEGGGEISCYRYPLWEKLFSAGYLVEFVGSRESQSRIGPLRHEGFSGKNAEYVAKMLGKDFSAHPADIVLIHSGHNHSSAEKPVHGIIVATEFMIRTVRGINPHVVVLLAQVIPSGKLPKYEYIPELNLELGRLASRLNTPEQPVIAVNMTEGFDWHTDTIRDHVHPNPRGAEKIAEHWFMALTNVMAPPPQSFHPKIVIYKSVGDANLTLHIFPPANLPGSKLHPAIIFFFGGGWTLGTPIQFYPECAHFAAEGFVAISADYRIASVNHTTPFESVADGKSAIRWLRQHAAELGVDPHRIVAAGASAGGQVAAAAGIVPGLDEPGDDLSISSKPDALLLWYAVVDNGPKGCGYDLVKGRYREISPLDNISSNIPPTLFFLGTRDPYVPVKTALEFQNKIEQFGGHCELKLFEGAGHPLYEYRKGGSLLRDETLQDADEFLAGLKFMPDQALSAAH